MLLQGASRVLRPGCSCGRVGTGQGSGRDRICRHKATKKHCPLYLQKIEIKGVVLLTPLSLHGLIPRSSMSGHHLCSAAQLLSYSSNWPLRAVLSHIVQPWIQCGSELSQTLPPPFNSPFLAEHWRSWQGVILHLCLMDLVLGFLLLKHSRFEEADCYELLP